MQKTTTTMLQCRWLGFTKGIWPPSAVCQFR